LGADVAAVAVVLPDKAVATRLFRDTKRLSGFVAAAVDSVSAVDPPGDADAAVAGAGAGGGPSGPFTIVAWTRGRLYGYVSASGPAARALATRIASVQEGRFERALAGDRLASDATLDPSAAILQSPYPPQAGGTVHPTASVPRIPRPGRYTLRDLGAGRLTFSPAAGEDGIRFPVTLALPPSPRGRWLWRITTHVIVTLARHAQPGRLQVYPRISQTGGPGASFIVARDLGTGKPALIDEMKHTETTTSLEVSVSAMMGGNPSPRQTAMFGFDVSYIGAKGALARVTVLPDSAIEVFDDPAMIGEYAIKPGISRALP
jgi:hypothetical protein